MLEPVPLISMARLHRDKIALYEQIHNQMTLAHAEEIRQAYERLDIYRIDDQLIMIAQRRPDPPPATDEDAARAKAWHASLAACFAEPWRPADPIFILATAGHRRGA